ncbi:MAG: hypothetical protein II038_13755, partial [Lachnospiraceae bacterium]|nr:hypothetical protein [Lachnospiraceae bacterium]
MDDFRVEELRSQIDPQSGANGAVSVVDIVAAVVDGAVAADEGSVVGTVAGGPQPPPAGSPAVDLVAVVGSRSLCN